MPQELLYQNGETVTPSTDGLTVTPKHSPDGADAFRAFVAEWGPKCWLTTDFEADNTYVILIQGENIDITCRPVPEGVVTESTDEGGFIEGPGDVGATLNETNRDPGANRD